MYTIHIFIEHVIQNNLDNFVVILQLQEHVVKFVARSYETVDHA